MGDAGTPRSAGGPFKSKSLEALLNVIDRMRSQGVSNFLDLPQIVCCGNQSSGKSSCLEALCQLKFPINDKRCTRYAREYILRRGDNFKVLISIQPDLSRPAGEQEALRSFKPSIYDLDQFGKIIRKRAMLWASMIRPASSVTTSSGLRSQDLINHHSRSSIFQA